MKAAVCYEFGKPLVIEDIELDSPRDGEVRVRLSACAICHSDIHFMDGAWGGRLPAIYGHEAAGVVEAAGCGVESVRIGDPVVVSLLRPCGTCFFCLRGAHAFCETAHRLDTEDAARMQTGAPVYLAMRTGGFAEHVLVDAAQVVPLPEEIPLDSAALLACGVITGFGAVTHTARVPAGSSVVVVGAGGVGLNCIQAARIAGADPVIAVDLLESKLQAARTFGAAHTVNAIGDQPEAAIRSLTAGRGADYVFVTVGSAPVVSSALPYLRRGGTLVMVGLPASGETLRIPAVDFADAGQVLMGSKMGGAHIHRDIPMLVDLYRRGELLLDELITARYPLESINAAVDAVRRGEALRNVIVFS